MTRGKLILWGALALALIFALQGGQYSTFDLLRQGSEKERLKHAIDSLEAEIDSLQRYRKALATDVRLQERLARELWGLAKDGEMIYKLVDTTGR